MSDLPEGWEWARFSDVAEVASNLVNPLDHPDAPHIAPNHIESGTGTLLPYTTVAIDGATSSKHQFYSGQLLYSKIRPYLAKVIEVDFDGLCSADMYPIDCHVDRRFLKWWMLTPMFTESTGKHQGRSLLPKINTTALAGVPVPVAPLGEQRRIVATLEDRLSRLDAGCSYLTSVNARSKKLEQSLVAAVVAASSRTEATVRIGDIASVFSGMTPLRSRSDYHENGTVPWITSSQVNQGLITEAEQFVSEKALSETSLRIVPAGSILVAMYGEGRTRGKTAELTFPATTNQACAAIVLREEFQRYRCWIKIFLDSQYETNRRLASGGVQPNLSVGLIKSMSVPLPPVETVDDMVEAVTEKQVELGRLQADVDIAQLRAALLRRSLLSEAFAGRLVSQDPTDEPASVLLDRIRAERFALPKPRRTRRAIAP